MSKIKQSLAWWCFGRHIEAEELIGSAKIIGYAGVEMAPEGLWPQIVDGGLKIITMGGHQALGDGLNKRENHDRIEAEIEANLEKAVQWGIPALIVFSGNREGLPDAVGLEHTIEGLNRVKKMAEDAGVTLVMELLNSKVDHPDYQCDHTAWGVALAKRVNSPRFKLLYDIYHMQIMEGDVARTVRDNINYIGHFHTGGVPGRHEIDHTQELDYHFVMKAIADAGFKGYVAQEFVPTKDPRKSLAEAVRICTV